ncbi:MAG: nucleoside hydrolase [Acidiferrobacteraceae bacterium]|nr:nucleoside hydrolase [Acidiferrobacteraceae bacterium]
MKRCIFVDTDTASDDAVALMMAFKHFDTSLVGIGIVAGNVPLEQATQNALFVRSLCGMNTPIHMGAAQPLVRPLQTAQNVHGVDGMGDISLPIGGRTPDAGHAVNALIAAAARYSGHLEVITLGPLTNLAIALSVAPEIVSQIKRCVIMGGTSDSCGNITPVSEFNLWVDPEAARIVFSSSLNKVMVGWDISRKYAVFNDAEASELREIGTEKARIAIDIQRVVKQFAREEFGLDGFDLPDPIAMAVLLSDDCIIRKGNASVGIDLQSGSTRGMTIIDDSNFFEREQDTVIVLEASRQYFVDRLGEALQ